MATKYKDIKLTEISELVNEKLILIVTATNTETKFTHQALNPLPGFSKLLRLYEGNQTYYFGLFGNYKIVHVQCGMGSISRDSSIVTVTDALNLLKTQIVIMIGLAFGVDETIQSIGDVLISESVIPYNKRRVGINDVVHRGIEAQASLLLVNRFKSIISTWEKLLGNGQKAKLIFTRLLSGEDLVDNIEYRTKLIEQFPDSKGGEMEGAGIFAACGNKIDWILIKGICDFADGNKSANKAKNQQMAIESALSACQQLFNSPMAFNALNIHPIGSKLPPEKVDVNKVNDVLFDLYDLSKEKYYINRSHDIKFNEVLNHFGVWIFGPSGCGKSNLIIRNLLNGNVPFIQINLAPYIGEDIESFFKEILFEITSKMEGALSQSQPITFAECSKSIVSLLNKYYKDKELIIFIEEIPINSTIDQKEFTEKLFSLIISKSFSNGLNRVRFILSSIDSPIVHIPLIQKKIHQYVSFIELNYWNEEEITRLIRTILSVFPISLSNQFKNELILAANGSPRFIKKFFRSLHTLNRNDEVTCKFVLNELKRELS